MPYDQASRTPCITVVFSKTTTVLEMEHNVIDFITLCESPYTSGNTCFLTSSLLYYFKYPYNFRTTRTVRHHSPAPKRLSDNGPPNSRIPLFGESLPDGHSRISRDVL